jgi:hypothetical protein
MVDDDHGSKVRPTSPDDEEKRESARYGVLRQGKILVDGRTIYCAVRDFSTTGAKLEVGVQLPPAFDLIVVGHEGRLRAELKWKNGDYVGVAFQPPLSTAEVERVRRRQRLPER